MDRCTSRCAGDTANKKPQGATCERLELLPVASQIGFSSKSFNELHSSQWR